MPTNDGAEAGFCNLYIDSAGGLWYSIEGTGSKMRVSTCNTYTVNKGNMDTEIIVYSGSCGIANLACIVGADGTGGGAIQTCNAWPTTVEFDTCVGTTYYVLVQVFSILYVESFSWISRNLWFLQVSYVQSQARLLLPHQVWLPRQHPRKQQAHVPRRQQARSQPRPIL